MIHIYNFFSVPVKLFADGVEVANWFLGKDLYVSSFFFPVLKIFITISRKTDKIYIDKINLQFLVKQIIFQQETDFTNEAHQETFLGKI